MQLFQRNTLFLGTLYARFEDAGPEITYNLTDFDNSLMEATILNSYPLLQSVYQIESMVWQMDRMIGPIMTNQPIPMKYLIYPIRIRDLNSSDPRVVRDGRPCFFFFFFNSAMQKFDEIRKYLENYLMDWIEDYKIEHKSLNELGKKIERQPYVKMKYQTIPDFLDLTIKNNLKYKKLRREMHEAFMYFYKRSILNLEDLLNLSATVDIIPYGLVDMFSKAFDTAKLKKLNFQFIDSSVVKINKAIEERLKTIEYTFGDDSKDKSLQNDSEPVISSVSPEISSEWLSTSLRPQIEENRVSSRQLVNDHPQIEETKVSSRQLVNDQLQLDKVSLNLSSPSEKDTVGEHNSELSIKSDKKEQKALPIENSIKELRLKLKREIERTRKTMKESA